MFKKKRNCFALYRTNNVSAGRNAPGKNGLQSPDANIGQLFNKVYNTKTQNQNNGNTTRYIISQMKMINMWCCRDILRFGAILLKEVQK